MTQWLPNEKIDHLTYKHNAITHHIKKRKIQLFSNHQ